MSDAAKRVYEIARRYDLVSLLENRVGDLERLAGVLEGKTDAEILNMLYEVIFFSTSGDYGCTMNGEEVRT